MRIGVTGAGGMLAAALVPLLRARGHEIVAWHREELDVTDREGVRARVVSAAPQVVVQCAAYTAVDRAEADEAAAFRVNAEGAELVATACQAVGARFVYPSTDYVFDGSGDRPYRPEDAPAPVSAYGRSKRAGEEAALAIENALIVRTSWLYGAGGRNFVDTVVGLCRERRRIEVVDDQVGRPTCARSVATVLARLVEQQATGIFHATDGGAPVSWFGVAMEIARVMNAEVEIVPVSSAAYVRPARRPAYSVLDCAATEEWLGYRLPDWRENLAAYLQPAAA